jgi:hypothetical protein
VLLGAQLCGGHCNCTRNAFDVRMSDFGAQACLAANDIEGLVGEECTERRNSHRRSVPDGGVPCGRAGGPADCLTKRSHCDPMQKRNERHLPLVHFQSLAVVLHERETKLRRSQSS